MKRPPDISRRQFAAALKRRGWRQILLWVDLNNGHSIGLVSIGGKINRRASLAHAIKRSDEIAAKLPATSTAE